MIKSAVLSLLGSLYGTIAAVRNRLYENGIRKAQNLNVPTISIGNLTVGGTGKTPLVAFVAQTLAESGEKVCILTRGYKRADESVRVVVSDGEQILANARTAGDEPLELARKLLGVSAVIADANRAAAGKWAQQTLGITAFVLDDGFQHRQVERDLDIVCIDATNPFGNGKFLSPGLLRESLKNLSRADAVVITRANLVDKSVIDKIKNRIAKRNNLAKIFVSENKIKTLTNLEDFNSPGQKSAQLKEVVNNQLSSFNSYLAFCALGNPENFFEQLRCENFRLASSKSFKDHHFYTQKDADKLQREAKERGAEALITTAKDAVKLKDLKLEMPCFVAENDLIFDDETLFRKLIQSARKERE